MCDICLDFQIRDIGHKKGECGEVSLKNNGLVYTYAKGWGKE